MLENELRERVLAILKRLPEGENVCHWNFTPENVIFTINGPVVLNWQDVGKGHFLADVARTSVLLSLSVDDNLTKILQGTYITEYLKICGRPDEELDRWGAVVAADKLCDGVVRGKSKGCWNSSNNGSDSVEGRRHQSMSNPAMCVAYVGSSNCMTLRTY